MDDDPAVKTPFNYHYMKHYLILALICLLGSAGIASAASILSVSQGGTGASLSGASQLVAMNAGNTALALGGASYTLTTTGTGLLTATNASTTALSVATWLSIPTSASLTTPVAGSLGIDTTSGQLRWSDVTGTTLPKTMTGIAFGIATSSLSGSTLSVQNAASGNFLASFYASTGNPTPVLVIKDDGSVGIGTSTPAAKLDVKGAAYSECQTLTDGATVTIDFTLANCFYVTLGGNRTIAFSNVIVGQTVRVFVTQDATGSRTLAYPTSVNWPGGTAPTLSTAGGKWDILVFSTATSSATVSGGSNIGY